MSCYCHQLIMPLLFFFSFALLYGWCVGDGGECLPDERALLLDLKHGFRFEHESSKPLVSWKPGSNCCSWEGVTCDTESAHVIGLDLSDRDISGNLSSSLFNLTSLQNLNLADNYFEGVPIPQSGFEKLTKLTHLNLSWAGLSGQIPIGISRLTSLISLDLSSDMFPSDFSPNELQLRNPNLKMLVKNLSNLRELYLEGVNMSSEHEWSKTLSTSLPRLQALSLSECDLPGSLPKDFFSTYKNLTRLDLSENQRLSGVLPDFPTDNALQRLILKNTNLSGPIPASIANLTQLTHLSITGLGLSGQFEFEKLTKLTHLSLSVPGLSGQIPIGISRLTSLISLDLSSFNNDLQLRNPNLKMLVKNLSNLRELSLDGVNMSSEHDWSKTLSTSLPRLQVLYLSYCDLPPGSLHKDFFSIFKKLITLGLLDNSRISGALPDFPTDNALQRLYLVGTNLSGPIPASIGNLIQVVDLHLSSNSFSGPIPASIGNLIQVVYLFLSESSFSGPIPASIGNLTQLVDLHLSFNCLTGVIPTSIGSLIQLEYLLLSSNCLTGVIPTSIGSLIQLKKMDLSRNCLTGVIPTSIGSLIQLESMDLSWNHLSGPVPSFGPEAKMNILDLSNNSLIGPIPMSLFCLPHLELLDLSYNNISGELGEFFNPTIGLNTTTLEYLDLHSNMLQGPIPLPSPGILVLDYSNNNFSSTIPSNISFYLNQTSFFSLANNIITGEIPPSICTAKFLQVLDFSNNSLSGSIPSCLLEGDISLVELNLRGNQLQGIIPQNISRGCTLERIMLDSNNLQGQLPQSMVNCKSLEVLDLGSNHIVDSFPFWLRNLLTLRVLILRSNKFYGPINFVQGHGINYTLPKLQIFDLSSNNFNGNLSSECFYALKAMLNSSQLDSSTAGFDFNDDRLTIYIKRYIYDVISITNKGEKYTMRKLLTIFTCIDFSDNAFEGDIPEAIGELQGLHVLNLSHNFLSGEIPPTIRNMKQVESLDLSANHLSGEIPKEMASLTFLSYLNLSDNNFIGKIPQGNQLSTFSNTSFQENPGLCGSPLSKQCGNVSPNITDTMSPSNSDSSWSTYVIGLALFVGLGFGVGIAVVLVLQNVPLKFWKKV